MKEKITISLDGTLLAILDKQRGSIKRSTYINRIIAKHFSASPEEGGETFVTTLELKKTLKPIYDKMVLVESLEREVEDLRDMVRTKKKGKK